MRTSILAAAALAVGCTIGTKGEETGEFSFYQPVSYPGDGLGSRGVDGAVALGSRLDVAVIGWDAELDGLPTWSVEDGDALSVESDGETVSLRADAVGSAKLRVISEDGTTDAVTLTVEALGSSEVIVDDGITWGGDVGPSALTADGYALRPGAAVTVGAAIYSGDGSEMSGFDFLEFTVDDALLEAAAARDLVNALKLTARGVAGDAAVGADGGGALALRLLDGSEANALRIFDPELDGEDDPVEIDAIAGDAGVILVGLAAFDDEGRFVIAGPDDEVAVTVVSGPANLVLSADYDDSLDGMALTACPGEGEVALRFAGGERTVSIAVTEGDDAPDGCAGERR